MEERFELVVDVARRVMLTLLAEVSKAAAKGVASLPVVFVLGAGLPLGAHGLDDVVEFEVHDAGWKLAVVEDKPDEIAGLGPRSVSTAEFLGGEGEFVCLFRHEKEAKKLQKSKEKKRSCCEEEGGEVGQGHGSLNSGHFGSGGTKATFPEGGACCGDCDAEVQVRRG